MRPVKKKWSSREKRNKSEEDQGRKSWGYSGSPKCDHYVSCGTLGSSFSPSLYRKLCWLLFCLPSLGQVLGQEWKQIPIESQTTRVCFQNGSTAYFFFPLRVSSKDAALMMMMRQHERWSTGRERGSSSSFVIRAMDRVLRVIPAHSRSLREGEFDGRQVLMLFSFYFFLLFSALHKGIQQSGWWIVSNDAYRSIIQCDLFTSSSYPMLHALSHLGEGGKKMTKAVQRKSEIISRYYQSGRERARFAFFPRFPAVCLPFSRYHFMWSHVLPKSSDSNKSGKSDAAGKRAGERRKRKHEEKQ